MAKELGKLGPVCLPKTYAQFYFVKQVAPCPVSQENPAVKNKQEIVVKRRPEIGHNVAPKQVGNFGHQ